MKAAEILVATLEAMGQDDGGELSASMHSLIKVASSDDGEGLRNVLRTLRDASANARDTYAGSPDVSEVTVARLERFFIAMVKAIKEVS